MEKYWGKKTKNKLGRAAAASERHAKYLCIPGSILVPVPGAGRPQDRARGKRRGFSPGAAARPRIQPESHGFAPKSFFSSNFFFQLRQTHVFLAEVLGLGN